MSVSVYYYVLNEILIIIVMSLIQIIQNGDDQELQISFEEQSFSNNFKKTNQSAVEVFDVKKILNHWIYSARAELQLFRNINSNKNYNHNSNTNKSNSKLNCNNLFSKLRHINVSYYVLTKIPSAIFDLKYLRVLNLSNNSLESLPKELCNLCNLVTLKLSGNKLNCLPKSLKHVEQLNYLDLSCNKFSEVPDVLFYGLRILGVLDLSCNQISKFNDPPGCLNKLVVLGLAGNYFKELPVWIFNSLCQLKFLDISQNQLSFSTEFINYYNTGVIESLQSLNVENCNLSFEDIQILSLFKNLKVLRLGNKKNANKKLKGKNCMGNFKIEKFKIFKEVKELYLANVLIATLFIDFDCLKNIEILDLSDNLLSWLPECFCDLINLKILNLTANQLLYLPFNIGNLINLAQIHLGNNKLNNIPESFCNLDNLEFADFYNNQIEKLNPCILKKKNLKGIDLGLNCLKFDFCEYNVDVNEFRVLYSHLKDSFRKHFCLVNSRFDLQITKMDEGLDEISSDSHSVCTKCSASSLESEVSSDFEDSNINIPRLSCDEDEDWEKKDSCQLKEDDIFDPNEVHIFQRQISTWNLGFRNNYCPADYHVPSVMETYLRNFELASKNDKVEEGQFDSD